MIMPVDFRGNILLKDLKFVFFNLGVEHSHQVVVLLEVCLALYRGSYPLYCLGISFRCQDLIHVGSVGLSMKCICHRLLIGFLTQRIVHEIEISLFLYHRIEVCEILLESAHADPVVEIFEHLFDFLIHLAELQVDLMNVTL